LGERRPQLCSTASHECFSSHSYLKRSSRPPPLRRPAQWILTDPPPQVKATCDPAIDVELLRETQNLMQSATASARARRGYVNCSCMGLNTTEALVQHTTHLERIEQASKVSAGVDMHMSTHGLPRLAFNSTLRPPHPPLPPFDPRNFLSVSQNFCPRASHLAHCVRTLSSLSVQVKSLSKVVTL